MIDAVGGRDELALADETRIPVDLVRSVVLRLRDRGLIDSDNRIIDRQRRRWESDQREDVYTSALAFRELVGGEVLPFVHVLDASNPIKTKDTHQKARTLQAKYSARSLGAPSTREVIDAVTQMMKRVQEHGHDARIPTIDQVRVEREPEDYLLDCRIAVQTRDADFRIADPFGVGFSRALEGVFAGSLTDDESLQSWMTNWLQSLVNPRPDDSERSRASGPYDTPENRRRYPNLVQALTPAPGASHRSVTDIYAALEWALFYICEANNPAIAIRQLSAETGPEYSERLSQVTASIGFAVPPHGFRPIPKGKFDDYENRKSEMETVLAIALLQTEFDEEHPMHALAAKHPDFIVRIRSLASDRGVRAHGARVTLTTDVELGSDAFIRGAISTILPAVRFDEGAPLPPIGSLADLLLDARTSLLDAFGYQSFAKLGPDTQNALLNAEKSWLNATDGDDAREFVGSFYAALQGVLRGFLGGAAPLGFTEGDYKNAARDRARQAGLGDLPQGIASVNPRRIRDALQGTDVSVGASVIALLLTSSERRLADLARYQRTFLADIAAVQERRGHGNEPVPMSKAAATNLRRTAITTLVTLLDLTNED
ncbi:hypothetical protein ASD30_23760 [Nocardioides sp. Root140]|nr:hypothetical protein ASD30_23760 [Nocardioides sp. Root140]